MSHALRLFGIHKRYRVGLGSCRATVEALRGVTLHVRPAEVVVITGPPGSGKSTLLMCAAGLLRPDRGRVHWFGESASPAGRPPGVIYRSVPSHYGCMTVAESLTHAMLRRDVTPTANALRRALERVEMEKVASVRLSRLAEGELRRLALAELVLSPPRIALLDDIGDEPDAERGRVIPDVIGWLAARGVTVLASTSSARTLAAAASRVLALEEGRLRPLAAPLPRALELTVDHAPRVASRLGRHRPARSAGPSTVRVALGGASAEEVLAECRRLGIAVHGSRVVMVGSLARARVAEEHAPVR
ncbi:MAG TPA: ATP-binding cassette domain-containing protein [Gemmatimonadaceae bacterium]|nr:ATP-binding cassette domain-containing protein [Gemmatimonadaceae bacterium]